ncbi:hypothetical protein [Haloimpatiens massiliensis]|uniref:hypothetical protein n=1 Tax=Haloimpatiens massiliensis TaxID=1658110 RepID=UPI000C819AC6|nr:hypothetical protein [Haloimpatiens massiliensis]
MDKNIEIIKDILARAIQITVNQKQDVSWEFYPLTKTLRISTPLKEIGLIKTYWVKVEDTGGLKAVQNELINLQCEDLNNDFLGL